MKIKRAFLNNLRNHLYVILLLIIMVVPATAQNKKHTGKGEFYFSWGYNTEWYTRSNVTVVQPELNNNYKLLNVKGHDHPGWDEGFFHKALTIPQYNYRLGYLFNKKRDLGIEINFDHTKYIITDPQSVEIRGSRNGNPIDSVVTFSSANGFYYFLNNGANFLLFNIVKRWHWYADRSGKVKIDFLGKVGIGPVIPHVQNAFFGDENNPGFQFGGWNLGLESAIRATFFRHIYLEFANKLDYARYSHLAAYKGTARQAFGTEELILNLGVTFGRGTKR